MRVAQFLRGQTRREGMPAKIRSAGVPTTLVGVALSGVLAALLASSGAEAASNVGCGDTITTDATLHRNLTDCPNNGTIIGADNITLDLNYHTIDSDGTPAAGCDPHNATQSQAQPG